MLSIIKDKTDLNNHIEKFCDEDEQINYLSMNTLTSECFVLFGFTSATEAFEYVSKNENRCLVITDEHDDQVEYQNNSEYPELCGIYI